MSGISIAYPFDEVYYIVNQGTKDAWGFFKAYKKFDDLRN